MPEPWGGAPHPGMRTVAAEHLSHAEVVSRITVTFGALLREQIETTKRFLESEAPDLSSGEGLLVDGAVRLVARGADWLGLGEIARSAQELREMLAQLAQLRRPALLEMISQARVELERETALLERLTSEGMGALLDHAELVDDAVEEVRAYQGSASAARALLDETTPELSPRGNLLGLTFEIKSAVLTQNNRLAAAEEALDEATRSIQSALSEAEVLRKLFDRRRQAGDRETKARSAEEHSLSTTHALQEAAATLRVLASELGLMQSGQYALERRARDLDEQLLWELLDPLDRFVEDLVKAVGRREARNGKRPILTVQTGGVGFEPQIGSLLLPLLVRLLERSELRGEEEEPTIRFTASREGLEARVKIEGYLDFDAETVSRLEEALEGIGGFVSIRGGVAEPVTLGMQFPMACSLRTFLIVEAAGQRVALPWSAVEHIHASGEELRWGAGGEIPAPFPLGGLFQEAGLVGSPEAETAPGPDPGGEDVPAGRPLAVVRCGGRAVVVAFERIVWRESARLTPLPPRLSPIREVMGGIVSPDGSVTLVLDPCALVRRIGGGVCREARS